MMKFSKLKKIGLLALGFGVVGLVVPLVATSCSAASTQPNVASSINFSLGGNKFSVSNGIEFEEGNGIKIGDKTYNKSPGYVSKVDGTGEGQDPESSEKNKASNSFVAIRYAADLINTIKQIDNILPVLANIGKIEEIAAGKTALIDVAKKLMTYQGSGPEVLRYGIKEIKFDASNVQDGSVWTKLYKDVATDKDDVANEVVVSFNVSLVYDYWKTTNGSNVEWQNNSVTEIKLNPLKITFKPERFEEESKWYFNGVYKVVKVDDKEKIELGGLDTKQTNELISNIAKINQVIRGDVVNEDISSYYEKNKSQFEMLFKIFL